MPLSQYTINLHLLYGASYYKNGGDTVVLSFDLGLDVAVNSIIEFSTLHQWGGSLEPDKNKISTSIAY